MPMSGDSTPDLIILTGGVSVWARSMDQTNVGSLASFSSESLLPDDPPDVKPEEWLLLWSLEQMDCGQTGTVTHMTDDPLNIKHEWLSMDLKEETLEEDGDVEKNLPGDALVRRDLSGNENLGRAPPDQNVEHRHAAVCRNSSIKSEWKSQPTDNDSELNRCPSHAHEERYGGDLRCELYSSKCAPTGYPISQTRQKRYRCDICVKAFRRRRQLIRHLLTHTRQKQRHSCDVCGKVFDRRYLLTEHHFIHTGQKPHSCDICGKAYYRRRSLTRHLLTHTGRRPHSCDVCEKAYVHKCDLTQHLLTHTGQKPHSCDICGKAFRRKSRLTDHLLTHSGQKPHSCDVCGKLFAKMNRLNEHHLIHTGQKPHRCDICGKAYHRRSNLTEHLLTHTGQKPHSCDVCGKAFVRKGYLSQHRLFHTGQKPYGCDVCGKAFRQKSELTRHLLRPHAA